MKKDVQGIILLLLAVTILRLAMGDQFLFYVAEGMKPWLVLSAVALLVLGGYALLGSWQEGRTAQRTGVRVRQADSAVVDSPDSRDSAVAGHDHGTGPRIAYLLLLPVLAVFVVAPSALGSFSAQRQAASSAAPARDVQLPPLPDGASPSLPLRDYVVRAVWDDGRTLQGRSVTMTGFVTPDPDGGWWLSRMAMTCCAADAQASRIKVSGAADLPADTWVRVTGTWVEGGGVQDAEAIPLIEAADVTPVPVPRNPYE